MSYVQYYMLKYNRPIHDPKQPMLVSNPKARDVRAGRSLLIYLVPELCRATGLTDKMRANFTMMRAMADHTQMDPERRKNRLLDFTKRLHESAESRLAMANFQTDIAKRLITFEGRALAQEVMLFGNGGT